MMEDEQNLQKNTGKAMQAKTSKRKKILANHRHGRKMQQKIQDLLI